MSESSDRQLLAHLLRRAGFGANHDELEAYVSKGYENTVEEFLHPEEQAAFEEDLVYRYFPYFRIGTAVTSQQSHWMLRMINTNRPLEEKLTLFWHHVFATGFSKVENAPDMNQQLEMLRQHAMGDFRGLLLQVSRDPAMVFWLDNCENHKGAPNENFGRELLELFSLGVGMDGIPNYTEEDVKECARAFTGWTIAPGLPRYPYGEFMREFTYLSADHDESEKVFLGHSGQLNGEDVIDIICRQPATARFISRHLCNFFVADEPQVPSWVNEPPRYHREAAIRLFSRGCKKGPGRRRGRVRQYGVEVVAALKETWEASGRMCDTVTGREDGNILLETLERHNLFVVPLDDKRHWNRYHHLFADAQRREASGVPL